MSWQSLTLGPAQIPSYSNGGLRPCPFTFSGKCFCLFPYIEIGGACTIQSAISSKKKKKYIKKCFNATWLRTYSSRCIINIKLRHILTAPFLNNFNIFFWILNLLKKNKTLKANMNALELILMMQIFLGGLSLMRMKWPCQPLNWTFFGVFYATYLMYENHLAEKILLTITGTLLISVRDRQEHGQDVYTAICKHFHWPSLNKK